MPDNPPPIPTSLSPHATEPILDRLSAANRAFDAAHPGESADRQPVHTVYGGAHLFKADTAPRMGQVALRTLEAYAPDAPALAAALQLQGDAAEHERLYGRVVEKLKREPVEDFRIDFEDGFGNRPDDEEDAAAVASARQVAEGMRQGTLPPFIGVRIKPLTEVLSGRAIRTLDIFVTTLCHATNGTLPGGFVVTIPKPTHPQQVAALAELLGELESTLGLREGALKLELMVETPRSIMNRQGASNLPLLLEAAAGRCVAAHFGVYDHTAACDITAAHQAMDHPACDFARHLMKAAFADTGVRLSDGATNIMPVAPHRGDDLTEAQQQENRDAVHRAWRLSHAHIRHSLINGYYQGWDLHPAQLPVRYATVYGFFGEGFERASLRLRTFVDKAAQATLVGDVFDDAATGQALLNFFLRAINCGAITQEEATRTGLTTGEIRGRSFVDILSARRGA